MTARERINGLVDEGSFREIDGFVQHQCVNFGMSNNVVIRLESKIFILFAQITGDGVVTGSGLIFGRPVMIYSQDFTAYGGSLSRQHAAKICKVSASKDRTYFICVRSRTGRWRWAYR